jgi:hypothetical protein
MLLGRSLIVVGLMIVALGVLISFGDKLPFRIGQLPGDFTFRGKNSTFYFPLATCVLLSIVLSAIAWLMRR